MKTTKRPLPGFILTIILMVAISTLVGCAAAPQEVQSGDSFAVDSFQTEIPFATPEVIHMYEANLSREYKIGSGDIILLNVWNRAKLSGEHIVGPYGHITLPIHGEFKIGGFNRHDAAKDISQIYQAFYDDPITTVKILKYTNNKVYVLGRVSNPGVIHFSGDGTLLEALSLAGGLPTRDKTIFLSKCYIVRGKDQIIWIDLIQLLQKANMKLNIRLANDDIIYIPESTDAAVFVMGEVKNPGSYQIQTSGLSLLDALNLAGSYTEDADLNGVRLIRGKQEGAGVKIIDVEKMLAQGDLSGNYLLKDNDILYLPRKGVATFNYYLRQIDPFLRTFISGSIIYGVLKN